MNQLSWLIYAADAAGDLNAVCGFLIYSAPFGLVAYCAGKRLAKAWQNDFGDPGAPQITPSYGAAAKTALGIWVASLIVGVATPSQDTMYAIAASEMGERIIASETAGKAVNALNAWLDRQIASAS